MDHSRCDTSAGSFGALFPFWFASLCSLFHWSLLSRIFFAISRLESGIVDAAKNGEVAGVDSSRGRYYFGTYFDMSSKLERVESHRMEEGRAVRKGVSMRALHRATDRSDVVRRAFIGTAVTFVAAPWRAQAQPSARQARIGFLSGATLGPGPTQGMVEPFTRGMRELGYVEGRNLVIEFRWADGKAERLPELLAELLRLEIAVLVTTGIGPPMVAKQATSTLPVVAVLVDDPVQMGLAASIARPGGNFTGISGAFSGILAKRFQLMKDIVPSARKFAVLFNPDTATQGGIEKDVASYERVLAVPVRVLGARGPDDYDAVFARMASEEVDAVAILADPTFFVHRARLGELCVKHRMASVWGHKDYLGSWGVASYQGSFPAMFHRAAALVDKILKGTKPGDIAFEQVTKLDMVINLKAAKALGLTVPQRVLLGADEVIE
ncbi:ABC transporter substrate-binding protein [Variovorax sp. J22R24]|uniref:ABC transporter substrate-binding protein n=1 Tax=Variovorax gracilis TaxID=3053502 RepID=UPI002575C262|nr:ABC transporter substrate-binding protein [Variovorax sp. J22R24]MDM0109785.1 ABC transporter substrate-binding protein [Variovorax sp. J22R24]